MRRRVVARCTQTVGVIIQSDGTAWWTVASAATANAVLDWGSHNKNVNNGQCLSLHNVSNPTVCELSFLGFMTDSTDTSFGPTPIGGMTISGLYARAFDPVNSLYQVVVFSISEGDSSQVLLSCTLDARNGPTCSDHTSAFVPGESFLQIRVTNLNSAPSVKWRATFLY